MFIHNNNTSATKVVAVVVVKSWDCIKARQAVMTKVIQNA